MNKNTSLFALSTAILLSFTIGFATENTNNRYNEIITALSTPSENFVFHNNDIQVVEEHKATLQKELNSYKNSWTPTLLKVMGAGFGLETIRRGVWVAIAADRTNTLANTISDAWSLISRKLYYLNYPISYSVGEISKLTVMPASDMLSKLYGANKIGSTTFDVGSLLLFAVTPVATGLIAKYLFDKANSYKAEIARLEEEIEKDNAIITALQNQ